MIKAYIPSWQPFVWLCLYNYITYSIETRHTTTDPLASDAANKSPPGLISQENTSETAELQNEKGVYTNYDYRIYVI